MADAPSSKKSSMQELSDSSPDEVAKKLGKELDKTDKWLRPNAAFAYWPVSIVVSAGLVLYLHFGPVQFSWTETIVMFLILCPIIIFGNAARIAGYRYPDKE